VKMSVTSICKAGKDPPSWEFSKIRGGGFVIFVGRQIMMDAAPILSSFLLGSDG